MSFADAAQQNLRWLLRPIEALLADPALTDMHINSVGEGQCFVDRGRGAERITLPYSFRDLEDIAVNAAAFTSQDIGADAPIVSASFPGNYRVQIVRPPAVADGRMAFSIRRPKARTWTPRELEQAGVFTRTRGGRKKSVPQQDRLLELYNDGQWRDFLELAVASGLNIVFSGPVGTGKTHVMRAFTHCIPADWRIVTIEDVSELVNLPCANIVNLLYSKGEQSAARVKAEDLVEASLRMGMNGLLNQELRDDAAYAYMNVLESGHWGMTTTHADSAEQTFDRIRGLIKKHPAGMHLRDEDVAASLYRSIDVVAYCRREGDVRYVDQILYDPQLKERHAGVRSPFAAQGGR